MIVHTCAAALSKASRHSGTRLLRPRSLERMRPLQLAAVMRRHAHMLHMHIMHACTCPVATLTTMFDRQPVAVCPMKQPTAFSFRVLPTHTSTSGRFFFNRTSEWCAQCASPLRQTPRTSPPVCRVTQVRDAAGSLLSDNHGRAARVRETPSAKAV